MRAAVGFEALDIAMRSATQGRWRLTQDGRSVLGPVGQDHGASQEAKDASALLLAVTFMPYLPGIRIAMGDLYVAMGSILAPETP